MIKRTIAKKDKTTAGTKSSGFEETGINNN